MNLDELENERGTIPARRSGNFRALWDQASQTARPLDVGNQVFGAKDYIPNPIHDHRMTVMGPTEERRACNAVSGYHEMCERGTVGCTNHRRSSGRFFRCYINHSDMLCRCRQPVIVDWQMLENAENAAMYVLGIMKGAKSTKLTPDDVQYLAVSVAVITAHWARKALGHKPEDEL